MTTTASTASSSIPNTTVEKPKKVTILSGVSLLDACSNALLFTSKDRARPILNSIRVAWDGAEEVIFEATDSYAVIRETVLASGNAEPFETFISRDEMTQIVAVAKAAGKVLEVSLRLEGGVIFASGAGLTVSVPVARDIHWPNCESLYQAFTSAPAAKVGLGAGQLLRLGKLKASGVTPCPTGIAIQWECGGDLKPSRFSLDNGRIIGLIMPVRMA